MCRIRHVSSLVLAFAFTLRTKIVNAAARCSCIVCMLYYGPSGHASPMRFWCDSTVQCRLRRSRRTSKVPCAGTWAWSTLRCEKSGLDSPRPMSRLVAVCHSHVGREFRQVSSVTKQTTDTSNFTYLAHSLEKVQSRQCRAIVRTQELLIRALRRSAPTSGGAEENLPGAKPSCSWWCFV